MSKITKTYPLLPTASRWPGSLSLKGGQSVDSQLHEGQCHIYFDTRDVVLRQDVETLY